MLSTVSSFDSPLIEKKNHHLKVFNHKVHMIEIGVGR